MSITTKQAEQLKELFLDVTFAMGRYNDTPIMNLSEKRIAWEAARKAEKAFETFVDSLTAI